MTAPVSQIRPPPKSTSEQAQGFADRFGQWLIAENIIDAGSFDRARRAAAKTGERLDHVLAKLGLMSDAILLDALGRHLGIPIVKPEDLPLAPVLPDAIRVEFVLSRHILPIAVRDNELSVAVVDPFDDEPMLALGYMIGCGVSVSLISAAEFARAVRSIYQAHAHEEDSSFDPRSDEASEVDVQRLRDIANEAPVIRLVNQFIVDAVTARSSDIHIEPGIEGVALRCRIDGQLRQTQSLRSGLQAAIASRIKIMAKLDIAERRKPQDGRIKLPVHGVDIDFRVSTTPTIYGESIVMRILDRSRVELDFVRLGFVPRQMAALDQLMGQPNGIVLVTGPTGSGKTTTLYAVLKRLSRPDVKVFTVEDPIEYQMAGLNQVQVHPAIGLDFPHALRSILRQDPDIIMIGEIRDLETARIAVQASLTGHLVFSTLHTNSAAATVTRLIDMGVENYLLISTVNGILAQRLVRRLCRECAALHSNAAEWRERITREIPQLWAGQDIRILSPVGCQTCNGTGFSGRIAIIELLAMNEDLRGRILRGAPDSEIERAARQDGMMTMFEDGLDKVGQGLTTIEEVLRATRMAP
jgi:general secretion pathway protein E